jgi:hypothetical protein
LETFLRKNGEQSLRTIPMLETTNGLDIPQTKRRRKILIKHLPVLQFSKVGKPGSTRRTELHVWNRLLNRQYGHDEVFISTASVSTSCHRRSYFFHLCRRGKAWGITHQ